MGRLKDYLPLITKQVLKEEDKVTEALVKTLLSQVMINQNKLEPYNIIRRCLDEEIDKSITAGFIDMDERINIDDMEQYQEKIKELFVELSSEELARTWADTFDIDEIDEKRITVIYHGTESVKLFKKKCRGALEISVHSLFGSVKKIKIVKKKKSNTSHKALAPKTKKNIKAEVVQVVVH